jgi:diguanylate cyclase (GGDEF)-like protein
MLLRIAARRLEGCVRQDDLVGRLGGDEFAVLCAGVPESGALEIAERVLRSLQEPFRLGEGQNEVRINVSIGVAVSASPMTEDLLKAADRALGAAKMAGRGRVCLAPPA